MKKIITILLLFFSLLLFTPVSAQQQKQEQTRYKTLGTFDYNNSSWGELTWINLDVYVLKNHNLNPNYPNYKYVFSLAIKSNSKNNNVLTSTWLYNTRILINGVENSLEQYPDGFTTYIRTTETIIWYWFTNDEDISYGIKWDDAIYDPKNVK